ncbi:MAG: type II toxin-antitoxin system Phd/YefM family antitoxin [Gammaproteobacteria bacterium]|nr:type II toxin-antitoxin system Phd/YefM family antitoxin [Gammaproteobacteria bacterium]
MNWQLQDAKARLSELVKLAQQDGPQSITVHGKPAAVVLSPAQYERLVGKRLPFVEFIRRSPLAGSRIRTERSRSPVREVDL